MLGISPSLFTAPGLRIPRQFRYKHPYIAIALIAFVMRAAVIVLEHTYSIPVLAPGPPISLGEPHFNFGAEAGSIAHSIATGHGFGSPFGPLTGPTAWLAPVYPYLCAAVFKLFGVFTDSSALVLLLLNSLFAALTCVPVYMIGERMMGRAGATLAACAWALLPYFWLWPTHFIWETSLTALLVGWAFLLTLKLAEQQRHEAQARGTLLGLLWGFMALTNPVLLTCVAGSVVWLTCAQPQPAPLNPASGWRGTARRLSHVKVRAVLLALSVCVLLVLPWLVRNWIALGRPVFIRDNFAFELYQGNFHRSTGYGWFGIHPSNNKRERDQYTQLGELNYIAEKRVAVIRFLRDYPSEFLQLTGKRVYAFWSGSMMDYTSAAEHPALPWMYGLLSLTGGCGLLLAWRRKVPGTGLFAALLLLYALPYCLAFPQARNRHTIEPELLVLTVFFMNSALRGRRFAKQEPAIAANGDKTHGHWAEEIGV